MPRTTSHPVTRRALVGLAGAATAGLLLAGCSSPGGSGGAPSGDYTAAPKDLKASITYALWDQTQVKAIQANLAGFKKEYPNISVNVDVTPYDTYFTKLQTEASSNTMPDLFWLNGPNFQLYADNGKVEPITGEIKAGAIDPKNYPSALVDLYTANGVHYGVPKDFDTIGLWYNKALFAKAGVAVPTSDWTWDDLTTAATTISSKLKGQGIYGVAAGMDGQTTYYDTIFQAGGNVISADGKKSEYASDATKKGIVFWRDLIASKGSPSVKQLTDTPADQWFVSGKAAMLIGGDWGRSEIAAAPIAKDVQVAPLPKGEQKATVIHGVSNVVAAGSRNKQAAQALQVYLASKAAQQQQGDMGAVIPAFNGTQDSFAKSMPGVDLQVFLDELAYAKPLPVSKNTAAWNALEAKYLPGVFAGTSPVDSTLEQLQTEMTAALAKG
ncbi:ABC transporter substrate-binding protein [Amnibacterium kyonggiense]|uniref:Carbohydrate ABC transporter substrate-binding protein (CUT1 family) n=1 Tax=Amnibacterium kyonggiense TaxID=595671 RepID=A0A4R7FL98_9MICO|nr:sugar ABC transporter substrate-binding protein [Amnibacterium kyonggiense]TDS77138.1 carbohydrate ABC transporter substrate-binding protein (CUT1 family) [Amnibacterium kyonggiense]